MWSCSCLGIALPWEAAGSGCSAITSQCLGSEDLATQIDMLLKCWFMCRRIALNNEIMNVGKEL